ncbi:putative ATP-dependent helicase IRC3 [Rhizina undulata]
MRIPALRNVCKQFLRTPFRPSIRTFQALSTYILPPAPPEQPEKLTLRPYQRQCIEAVLKSMEEGYRRLGISLATGSGKTVIFTDLISKVHHPTNKLARQTMIIVHKVELVEQAAAHCKAVYPYMTVELEMASSHASGNAHITVASVQSLVSNDRFTKFDPKKFKLILLDECHHAVAPSYLRVLDHFGVLDPVPEAKDTPYIVGVSATMFRPDNARLSKVMDYIVYHRDFTEMMHSNWLAPIKLTTIKADFNLFGVQSRGGDFNVEELSIRVNTDKANDTIVRAWFEKAKRRKSTLVFCVDIAHVHNLTAKFRDYGIDAKPITYMTVPEERQARLRAFRNGKIKVLVNCGVFTEGVDIPNIDCVVLARPTKSLNLVIQMIGRGLRLHPGKEDCYILDMVGSHVEKGIFTVPTLFGLDPNAVETDATIEDMEEQSKEQDDLQKQKAIRDLNVSVQPLGPMKKGIKAKDVIYEDYNLFDLIGNHNHEKDIRSLSKFAWVKVDFEKYVLTHKSRNGFIELSRNGNGMYQVNEIMRLPPQLARDVPAGSTIKPLSVTSEINSFADALREADMHAQKIFLESDIETNAAWRSSPATEQQINIVRKFKSEYEKEWLDKLTQGKASDIIVKMRHGPAKEWQRHKREKKLMEREMKEEERLLQQEERRLEKERREEELLKRREVRVGKLE